VFKKFLVEDWFNHSFTLQTSKSEHLRKDKKVLINQVLEVENIPYVRTMGFKAFVEIFLKV
jgi:hypothetical protein